MLRLVPQRLEQSLPQVPRHQLHEQLSSQVTWLNNCRRTHGSMCLENLLPRKFGMPS